MSPGATVNPHFASRRTALAIALLFGLTSVASLATPARSLAWDGNSFDSSAEAELIALTNRARAGAGLKALRVDSTLASVARWRSKDMIDRDYFSHDIPDYGRVFDKLNDIGYCYKIAGENIGWNTYPDDQATAAIQQMFMDSPGHRANILGTDWDVIGVGAYKGSGDKKMWTVLFADTVRAPTPTPNRRSPPRSRRPGPPPRRPRGRRPTPTGADADHRPDGRTQRRSRHPADTRADRRPRRPSRRRSDPESDADAEPVTRAQPALPRPQRAPRPNRPRRPARSSCASSSEARRRACSRRSSPV